MSPLSFFAFVYVALGLYQASRHQVDDALVFVALAVAMLNAKIMMDNWRRKS